MEMPHWHSLNFVKILIVTAQLPSAAATRVPLRRCASSNRCRLRRRRGTRRGASTPCHLRTPVTWLCRSSLRPLCVPSPLSFRSFTPDHKPTLQERVGRELLRQEAEETRELLQQCDELLSQERKCASELCLPCL